MDHGIRGAISTGLLELLQPNFYLQILCEIWNLVACTVRCCDTIAAMPPFCAIPFRGQLDLRYPPCLLCKQAQA